MLEKVIVPSVLFILLNPGVIVDIPGGSQTRASILLHSLVFIAAYWTVAKILGLHLVKADLIVPAFLFVLMSPGLITGKTDNNFTEILARGIMFGIIFALLRKQFPQVY